MIKDFFGKELKIGDNVIAVIGKHLRQCEIENIIEEEGYPNRIKYKDLKRIFYIGPKFIVKID